MQNNELICMLKILYEYLGTETTLRLAETYFSVGVTSAVLFFTIGLCIAVDDPYPLLIEEIQILRRKLGPDYLDNILKRVSNIEDDVIIAVHNKKSIK